MYLLIDSTDPAAHRLTLTDGAAAPTGRCFLHPGHSSPLLSIAALLAEVNSPLSALRGVAVRVGQGSFTALRSAVTVGNTLGFTLGIPVIAWEQESERPRLSERLRDASPGTYVAPRYSAPPRIGGS